MLQTFRLVMHLVPFHPKNFGEHALDQMMANRQLAGDLPPAAVKRTRPSVFTRTNPSFFKRRTAMVTAGGETLSQCASVAEMTVSPSLSASRIALR